MLVAVSSVIALLINIFVAYDAVKIPEFVLCCIFGCVSINFSNYKVFVAAVSRHCYCFCCFSCSCCFGYCYCLAATVTCQVSVWFFGRYSGSSHSCGQLFCIICICAAVKKQKATLQHLPATLKDTAYDNLSYTYIYIPILCIHLLVYTCLNTA